MSEFRIDADWVLAAHGPIADASVVVANGEITWVGLTRDAPAAESTEGVRGVLAPGLIDAHTHLGLSWARALGPIEGHPVYDLFWPLERSLTPDLVDAFAAVSAAEALLSGTTCVADHYFFAEASMAATTRLGIRSVVGETIVVTEAPHSGPESMPNALAVAERLVGIDLVHPVLAPHALDTVGDDVMREIVAEAERLDVPVHLHVAQSEREITTLMGRSGVGPVERLHDLGLFERRVIAAHCMYASTAGLSLLAAADTVTAIYCPTVHAHLGRTLRAAELRAAGGHVGLGSDAVPMQRRDLGSEVRAASALQAVLMEDAEALPLAAAMDMATTVNAEAVGLGGVIGAIEVGFRADLVAHRTDRAVSAPFADPAALVAMSGPDLVDKVWVDGRLVVADGELVRADQRAVAATANAARAELFERAGR